ncbi:CGNR zinc finger domain-containing protein [Methyloligella solikamskensis]|uniref:CGNR zinc finger domain-containing protein n=1 Tax=Methyloligella solikamskensis TaxID=1177756 RepID=A0ABW3J8T4_9HYPH
MLIADDRGLDFLNSLATPHGEPVDWLADGEGLVEWLREAELVPADALDEIAKHAKPAELDRVAGEARELRDWFRSFVTAHMGRPLTEKSLRELAPLNTLLERDEIYGQVTRSDEAGQPRLSFVTLRRWRSPDTLLFPIAEAMAHTITEEDFAHVKACEGHDCILLFADHTRAHARRWCSMSVCGNRAKVAAHRKRKKAQ